MGSGCVVEDLKVNHNREVVKNTVQRISEAVAAGIQAKEEEWSYPTPEFKQTIANVFDLLVLKHKERQQLIELRDALLPKLMSGEIRVPIEEVAADV